MTYPNNRPRSLVSRIYRLNPRYGPSEVYLTWFGHQDVDKCT